MRKILNVIWIFLLPLAIMGQQELRTGRAYSAMPLPEFARAMELGEGLDLYFPEEGADTIRTRAISANLPMERALQSALEGSALNFYIRGDQVFIFRGRPLHTDLSHLETPKQTTSTEDVLAALAQEDESLMVTKEMSEKRYLQVGRYDGPRQGRMCRVRGHISGGEAQEALIGATVYVKETEEGTISDVSGDFSLDLAVGNYTIMVNHMSMKETEYGLNVLSGGRVEIYLEEDLIQLDEVTVTESRHSNVEGVFMGYERISVKSMKEVPVVLGEKDVLKIAQLLPGVQTAGEGSAGFNVRGGSADQNMFYINKVSVYNTSHLFGFFTSFSPDVVSDFALYKNNVPAKYGGRIASIFNISTRKGNKDHFFAQGGISPITAHMSVEGPLIREKVSYVASVRSTYSDWILKRLNSADLRNSEASFNDITLGLDAKINPNNLVNVFYYRSKDNFSLGSKNDYAYSNEGGSLTWDHRFSKTFSVELSGASSEYDFSNVDMNNISEAYSHAYSLRHSEARADFVLLPWNNHRVEFGLNSILYQLNRGDVLPYGSESTRLPVHLGLEQGLESSVYISDEFELLPNRLSLLLGLRYSYYSQLGPASINEYEEGQPKNEYTLTGSREIPDGKVVTSYSGFEPRAALNLKVGPYSSVKAAYNRMQQYVFLLSNTVAIAPNDQWKLTDYYISPPVSDQVSIGFYHDVRKPSLNLSIEFYKKWVDNIVEYKDGADFISPLPLETQVLQGIQDVEGVEVMIRKNKSRLTGWLSYTWSRSSVLIDGAHNEDKVNGGIAYPSNYDKPHSVNLVANLKISRRVSIASNVVYSTGRPVTIPVAQYDADGQNYFLYSSRNAYRIPDYFRVDLSLNLEGNLKSRKFAHSFWSLNIYNLTGRENAYSVYYQFEEGQAQGYQLSIFARPIVTLSWNFKFGNYNSD